MNRSNDDKVWEERKIRCAEILKELLQVEFKGKIKKRVFVTIKEIEGETPGEIINAHVIIVDNTVRISVNKYFWSRCDFDDRKLRNTLRHELLHAALEMQGDDDPVFREEAQRKGVSINIPKKNVCWLCSECGLPCKRYAVEGIEECSEFFRKNWLI